MFSSVVEVYSQLKNHCLQCPIYSPRYTMKKFASGTVLYAIALQWPESEVLSLDCPTPQSNLNVTLLGYPRPIQWRRGGASGMDLTVPLIPFHQMPGQWGWVFKIQGHFN